MTWNYLRRWPFAVFLFLLSLFSNVLPVAAQKITPAHTSTASQPTIIKYTKNLTVQHLNTRPDSDLVELSNGTRVRLGEMRRLDSLSRQLKAIPDHHINPARTQKPAATARLTINSAPTLTAALKLKDTETIQMPSGKRYTVAQFKIALQAVEKRLFLQPRLRSLPPGSLIKVDAKTDWKAVLSGPETTILQSPNGSRITVAELRKSLAALKPIPQRSLQPSLERRQP